MVIIQYWLYFLCCTMYPQTYLFYTQQFIPLKMLSLSWPSPIPSPYLLCLCPLLWHSGCFYILANCKSRCYKYCGICIFWNCQIICSSMFSSRHIMFSGLKFNFLTIQNLVFYMVISEVAQLCPTLCNPMDCSLPGSSIHGIFQARVLEWVIISFSRGSSKEYFNFIIQHEAVFSSSPTPVAEENVFSPLCILLYFVIDYLTMD